MSHASRRTVGFLHQRHAAHHRTSIAGPLLALAALGTMMLVGCADATTAPMRAATGAGVASRASAGFPTALASPAWDTVARALVAGHSVSPTSAARVYALVSVAQYGGVVAADESAGDATLVAQNDGFGPGGRSRFEAERGAVAGASAQVLGFLFPDAVAALEAQLAAEGEQGPGNVHPNFTLGVAAGRAMGDVMIAWAKADRFTAPFDTTGSFPAGVGLWTRNPLPGGGTAFPASPLLGKTQPYFLTSGDQFRPAAPVRPLAPPAVTDPAFTAALDEVRALAAGRTPAQLALSRLWDLNLGTPTALGHWDEIAEGYITQGRLGERAATHLLALANAAAMDAAIGCWDAKYEYLLIRPWQVDPTISTPLGKPNHPSFPSGHSCISAAAGAVIADAFPEHASEVDGLVADAGMSRILAGIHYRFDVAAGQALGRAVAANAIAYDRANGLLAAVR